VTPFDQLAAAAQDAVARVGELDGRFLLPALALQLATLGFRAVAWRNILAAAYPEQRIRVGSIACAYAAGVALNAFTPARGGEALKVLLARTRIPGSSVTTIAGSLTVVFAFDVVLGMALMGMLFAVGALPGLPGPPSIGLVPLVGVVALVTAVGIAFLVRPDVIRGVLRRAALGLAVLRSPRRYLGTVVPFQLAAWACRVGVVFLVLQAFRIDVSPMTAVLVLVLSGASTAVPVPGGAGTQQVLAAYALQGATSIAGAVSFSVGMQVGVTVVNTIVGVVATMVLFRTIRPLAAVRAARAVARP
jgi:uncharacterized membrane protein YbhN (UPF0104 family)